MHKRRICFVSGSRAEYGLLSPVMDAVRNEPSFLFQLIVTGMHLAPQFGLTWREIEADGFAIDERVDLGLSDDTASAVTRSLGRGIMGFADALEHLRPDILVLLGDRYEILGAVQAALIARIPVAHIAGGDTTEGAFDDAIRHSITKMAHLHFVTNDVAARRVLQLGEDPAHVYTVGSPGIDVIRKTRFLGREALERELGFKFRRRNLLVTFHPVTLDEQPAGEQFRELLAALDLTGEDTGVIFTLPNADPGNGVIAGLIAEYSASRPWTRAYVSLGQLRYLSTIAQVNAVVGNSSSGLYEVPSFRKPTVNIGDRQKGRLEASSVINCRPETGDIVRAINEAFEMDCSKVMNPYGDGRSSERITTVLREIPDFAKLLKKKFFKWGP